MKYEAIFFDWDGVITDSVNIKTDSYYDMFKDYGKEIQERVKAHHLQNGGMSRFEKFKIYYKEFLGIEIDEKRTLELSDCFSKLVKEKVSTAPLINGAVETIEKEFSKGTKLFIVSGTPTGEIQAIASAKGLDKYFIEICGSPKKKSRWVKELLEKYNLQAQNCLFIGDAMADYSAAMECGLEFLGVKIPGCKTQFPANTVVKDRVEL